MEDILYIVMPAYNEAENIERTVREWYPIIERHNGGGKSRLVIFNDGSRDNTFNKCKVLEEKYQLFEIIDKENSGHGPTLIAAYNYAIEKGADYVFQTDSDGQTNPEEFEAFWEDRQKNDAIIGVRKKREDGKNRAFVERVVCLMLRIYFGVKVKDANAPFRLMRASELRKYLSKLPEDYNIPNIMLTAYFACCNSSRVSFREISFKPRTAGNSSINVKKIIGTGFKALGDFHNLKKDMQMW
ncbi:MAG: glycosyltransferase family 2 protein [Pseudobutyrivibrio sp.]|nr:glycosyltransferase family 2 protein [Pseudobutyrivibrio sp.]MCF0185536.1 glycosyltransferase family 2 protein [Bacteroidaceae bacterium]